MTSDQPLNDLECHDAANAASLATTLDVDDDKWLRRIGAEQKLFGGVTVTGSVSETPSGFANRSVSAGFKANW